MTYERHSVRAYWGARPESPRALAEQLATTIQQLGQCDELLGRWNDLAYSYREALRLKVEPTPEALERLFTTVEPADPTLGGYDITLWNGRAATGRRCSIQVTGGMIPRRPTSAGNNLMLDLPRDPNEAVLAPDVLVRIITVLVRIWRPDTVVVMSNEYQARHIYGNDEPIIAGKPKVGWMTYLRNERLAGLPAEVPYKTVDIDGMGTIFIVTDDHLFTVENPDDVARALELTAFLEQHGAVEEIPMMLPM